ncbi:MAG: 6-phosphogluconate dehydrogenase (decarboxylating), partial [Xanthomonas perforans]|nr:6-phosphogluconate dehydrogenase (decarboxylating) [Xanthomonas perforans]
AGLTGKVVDEVAEVLEPGDIIIDGGNSNYRDDVRRAKKLDDIGIHYVDVGTSGGVFGLERGYCLMVGGHDEAVAHLEPV